MPLIVYVQGIQHTVIKSWEGDDVTTPATNIDVNILLLFFFFFEKEL